MSCIEHFVLSKRRGSFTNASDVVSFYCAKDVNVRCLNVGEI